MLRHRELGPSLPGRRWQGPSVGKGPEPCLPTLCWAEAPILGERPLIIGASAQERLDTRGSRPSPGGHVLAHREEKSVLCADPAVPPRVHTTGPHCPHLPGDSGRGCLLGLASCSASNDGGPWGRGPTGRTSCTPEGTRMGRPPAGSAPSLRGRWVRAAVTHSTRGTGGCSGATPRWRHLPGTGGGPLTPAATLSLLVTQTLRSAALEDCALCQETLSSSELAAKTRDGDLEGA